MYKQRNRNLSKRRKSHGRKVARKHERSLAQQLHELGAIISSISGVIVALGLLIRQLTPLGITLWHLCQSVTHLLLQLFR